MDLRARLQTLGLTLPPAPKPVAAYVPCIQTGHLLFVSGQLPLIEGKLLAVGRVPSQIGIEAAQAAARQSLLNALAIVDAHLQGDWRRFDRIVRVGVFVASENDFTQQPLVANGASELLVALFDDAGRHARAAVGVNTLPLGACVEVELTVALHPG